MVASHRSVILQLRTRLASLRLLSLELEPLFYQLSPLSPERCNAFHLTPITPGFSAEPTFEMPRYFAAPDRSKTGSSLKNSSFISFIERETIFNEPKFCHSHPIGISIRDGKKSGWHGSLTLSLDKGDEKKHQTNRIQTHCSPAALQSDSAAPGAETCAGDRRGLHGAIL